MNIKDISYVRSVLAEHTASNVADGHLEPPAGARTKTRAGFKQWLRRAILSNSFGGRNAYYPKN